MMEKFINMLKRKHPESLPATVETSEAAATTSSSSSSSSSALASTSLSTLERTKHHVFLSFRGEDTRLAFTSHLHAALQREGIETYIDDRLERGQEISPALLKAIKQSKVSVVIFSENYAGSSWCLDELVHILKCKDDCGQIVIPVFYHVDTSSVRHHRGSYGAALALHRKRYWDKLNKVDEWSVALTNAANLSGWDSANIRRESDLVEQIVRDIKDRLRCKSPNNEFMERFVGIAERAKEVETMLDIGSPNFHMIGIWGMGGIGKTTLAKAVYTELSHKFDASCFLEVRKESKELRKGINYLRNKLFFELLGEKNPQADDMFRVFSEPDQNKLKSKNVFIVLDDVNSKKDLTYILRDRACYSLKSRIIVTSRDAQVMKELDAIYKIKEPNDDEALRLIQLYVPNNTRSIDFARYVITSYPCRNPLALEVLASALGTDSTETSWACIVERFKQSPHDKVQNVLKTSYYELNKEERDIFLDIACFLNREGREFAERILDGLWILSETVIENLIDKSLLTIEKANKLWMQHLIELMGRQIVRQQCREPGGRSRLWDANDICHVFSNSTGTAAVEGIFLDMCRIDEAELHPSVFIEMRQLRMLKLHSYFAKCILQFPEGLASLPNSLRYLYWDDYPMRSLPLSFTGRNLVELHMRYSKVERLWTEEEILTNLKVIDLSFSKRLIEIPYLCWARKIESVILKACKSLLEVPSYFIFLENLTYLDLEDCSSLQIVSELPRNIVHVSLTRCKNLKFLPRYIRSLEYLRYLELSGCSSINHRDYPEILDFL